MIWRCHSNVSSKHPQKNHHVSLLIRMWACSLDLKRFCRGVGLLHKPLTMPKLNRIGIFSCLAWQATRGWRWIQWATSAPSPRIKDPSMQNCLNFAPRTRLVGHHCAGRTWMIGAIWRKKSRPPFLHPSVQVKLKLFGDFAVAAYQAKHWQLKKCLPEERRFAGPRLVRVPFDLHRVHGPAAISKGFLGCFDRLGTLPGGWRWSRFHGGGCCMGMVQEHVSLKSSYNQSLSQPKAFGNI